MPKVTIVFNGTDITEDLAEMFISMEYSDTVEGESSTLEIILHNIEGLWSNNWYPDKGNTISAKIGDLDCGTFTVDEVVLSGPPDQVKIRCLENVITKQPLRQKRSKAHESKSLKQIAQHVADVNGLTLIGNVPSIMFERISQHRESDLKFLRRISYQFGIIFSVRDKNLVFTKLTDQDKKKAAFSVHRTEMISYKCTDKTFNTFKAVRLLYHNPKSGELISHSNSTGDGGVITLRNNDGIPYPQVVAADVMVIHGKAENKQQAEVAGDSMLYRSNTLQQSGAFSLEGNALAVAGVNMEATGLGDACSGIWSIQKSVHFVDRPGGWVVDVEVKRLALISSEKAQAAADAKSGSGSGGGLADLIGTGNMGTSTNYIVGGKVRYPGTGKDITPEKLVIQQALRYMIDIASPKGFKALVAAINDAKPKVEQALSGMRAKGHPNVADAILPKYRRCMVEWNVNPDDPTSGNELAQKLIDDIPTISDKSIPF